MEEPPQTKWEGKAIAKVLGPTPKQVWPLIEDFCSLNKFLPSIDTCHQLEGTYGKPGLVRYCASTVPSSSSDGEENITKWCHEKLVAIDPVKWSLAYEVVKSNMGFGSYLGTINVLSMDGEDEGKGCLIEWSFVADPIQGWTLDGLLAYIDSSVRIMAENIAKALE